MPRGRVPIPRAIDRIGGISDERQLRGAAAPAIADHANGLPILILPDAATLAYEQRHRRPIPARPSLAPQAGDSFRAAYGRLDQPARLLLRAAAFFNTQQIPAAELSQHFMQALHWTEGDVQRTFDACLDLHLVEDWPTPLMHQLFAAFVRETPLGAEDESAFARVGGVQAALRRVGIAAIIKSGRLVYGDASFKLSSDARCLECTRTETTPIPPNNKAARITPKHSTIFHLVQQVPRQNTLQMRISLREPDQIQFVLFAFTETPPRVTESPQFSLHDILKARDRDALSEHLSFHASGQESLISLVGRELNAQRTSRR